eukprot:353295-Chlamydomonas_euryale.AAC.4
MTCMHTNPQRMTHSACAVQCKIHARGVHGCFGMLAFARFHACALYSVAQSLSSDFGHVHAPKGVHRTWQATISCHDVCRGIVSGCAVHSTAHVSHRMHASSARQLTGRYGTWMSSRCRCLARPPRRAAPPPERAAAMSGKMTARKGGCF